MRSRAYLSASLVAALAAFCAPRAFAEILITVDKDNQSMTVTVDGEQRYAWPVSTGAPGFDTPSGTFRPNRMDATHLSQEWDNAPMPHAIFFDLHGHAIHGFLNTVHIGDPGSHGCVRLQPEKAALLYTLIAMTGMRDTTVVISGRTPSFQNLLMTRRHALGEARAALPDVLPLHSDAQAQPYDKWPATHLEDVLAYQQLPVPYETLRPPPIAERLQADADRRQPLANGRQPQPAAYRPPPATNGREPQPAAYAPPPATNAREPQPAAYAPPPATNSQQPTASGQQPGPNAAYPQPGYRQARPYYVRPPYGMPPAYYAQYLRQFYYGQPAYQQQYYMLQPRNPY
jgi:hypothetical protein